MKHRLFSFLLLLITLPFGLGAQSNSIWQAIKECDPYKAEASIEAGADLNEVDAKGRTPLLAAAAGGTQFQVPERQLKIVKMLLEAKSDPNVQDERGFTPMHYAAFHGNYEMVDALISYKAKIDLKCDLNQEPLIVAARYPPLNEDRKRTFEKLLENGASPLVKDNSGKTAIHWLCSHKTKSESPLVADRTILAICQALNEKGASLTNTDDDGNTPFAYAVREGHGQTTLWLLDKGANARAKSLTDYNALHYATERGQIKLVDRLIKAGLDLNGLTNDKHQADAKGYFFPKGSTALDIAMISEYEAKDNFIKKEWKGLAAALKQRGAISRTYKQYVKGFNVMKGPKAGGGSKIR